METYLKKQISFRYRGYIYFFCLVMIGVFAANISLCGQTDGTQTQLLIKNQQDFDSLNGRLNQLLTNLPENSTQTVSITFFNGLYKFNNSTQLKLSNITRKNVQLIIKANAGKYPVRIISDGNEYNFNSTSPSTESHYFVSLKSAYAKKEIYVDQDFRYLPLSDCGNLTSTQMNQATTSITIVDTTAKLAKMGIPRELAYIRNKNTEFFKNSLIYWKSWYVVKFGTIERTDDSFIYFHYNSDYVLNGDFTYAHSFPLFYITNISNVVEKNKVFVKDNNIFIPKAVKKIYECKYQTFANFSNVHLKGITISGFTFCGSALFNSINNSAPLIGFDSTDNIVIADNTFRNLGNATAIVCSAKNTDYDTFTAQNCSITGNNAIDLSGQFVSSFVQNTTIKNNTTINTGLFYKSGSTILVSGKNYTVSNNVIKNFAYIGIRVGTTRVASYNISGTIELNEVFYDDNFRKDFIRQTIMDGGGIYIFTHNDNTVCRYNIIHNLKGRKHYRGIFCDDGTYNTQLIGNLIYGIDDYTIDLRYNIGLKATPPFHPSANNICQSNILMGQYKFQGNPSYKTSSKIYPNYIGSKYVKEAIVVSGVDVLGKDINDEKAFIKENKVYITGNIDQFHLPSFILNRISKINN